MELDDLKSARDFADDEERTRDIILGRETEEENDSEGREYEFGEVPINQEIGDHIQETVVNRIKRRINKCENGEHTFEEFDVSNINKDTNPVQYLEKEEFPFTDSMQEVIEEENNLDETDYGEDPKPEFQALRIKNSDGEMLVAIRNYTNRQIINKKNKYLMKKSGDTYNKFDDEPIALPSKIDAVYYDGVFYIFKQQAFEDIFDYTEHLQDSAESVLDTIEDQGVLIHDMEDLREGAMRDSSKLRKLHEVSESGIAEELDLDTAKDIINDYELPLDITENGDGEEGIKIPNGRHVWTAIRLFNNDHLESPVNEDRFQVYNKDKRSD
jgi:hypothetical protein